MKRVVAIAGLIAALLCAGCNQQTVIKGSVDTVVKQAQDVSVDDKFTVEVTGELDDIFHVKKGDHGALMVTDDNCVSLLFSDDGITAAQAKKLNGGRFTAVGRATGSNVSENTLLVVVDEIK